MDEFAFLEDNLADEFIASVFPTLSSSKESKLVIVSTPNGVNNAFHKIWVGAEQGTNGFVAVKGHWSEARDQAWADEQLKALGEVKFKAEVLCVDQDTNVIVKQDNTIVDTTIGKLYNSDHDNVLIKTDHGYCKFDFVIKKHGCAVKIVFDNGQLICAPNHRVLTNDGFIEACNLKPKQFVKPNSNVVSITLLNGTRDLYDVVNIDNCTSSYFTNNVISHNCEFAGSSHTLVDGSKLANIPTIKPLADSDSVRIFEYPQKDHIYVGCVDTSRGRGRDHSATIIYDVTTMPYKVVCTFKNNKISVLEYPTVINILGRKYNNATLLIENNDLGESVANSLWYDHEYEDIIWTNNEKIAGHGSIGVKTSRKVKQKGCSNIKELIEHGQLIVNDERIIEELNVYTLSKHGLYAARNTKINDDLCTCLFLFGWLIEQSYFEDLTSINTGSEMTKKFSDIVDDYVPVGFRVDGTEHYEHPSLQPLNNDQLDLLRM